MKHRPKRTPASPLPRQRELEVVAIDHDGCGVARDDGKVWLIEGALPGERVRARAHTATARFVRADCAEIIHASAQRQLPACRHFGVCGGCALQHLEPMAQVHWKQEHVREVLERVARISPARWLEPIVGETQAYRTRARLSVLRHRDGTGRWVGFRHHHSDRIERIEVCPILDPLLEKLLPPLQSVIEKLPGDACPSELLMAVDQSDPRRIGIVFDGVSDPACLSAELLKRVHGLTPDVMLVSRDRQGQLLQHWGPEQTLCNYPAPDIEFGYGPADFVQANNVLNRRMLEQVIALLDPAANESALDLFCGLGNFSLPLAQRCREVIGIDLGHSLIGRARDNARANGIETLQFESADLATPPGPLRWARRQYDMVLLDPPRAGAAAILDTVARCAPRRVAYVSCYPGTLARDIGALVHTHGFNLEAVGVMDMFPHTAHVECVAFLTKKHD